MSGTLHEAQLVADLAAALYEFPPGKPHADGNLSFSGAPRAANL